MPLPGLAARAMGSIAKVPTELPNCVTRSDNLQFNFASLLAIHRPMDGTVDRGSGNAE